MSLALTKSYPPMEALPAAELPSGPQWQYEPKWDGFRCLAFRDGKRVDLMSKSSKALTRYFPELVTALAALSSPQSRAFRTRWRDCHPIDGTLSFDQLLMRIHPAASRIQNVSEQTPCVFIVFDLLVDDKSNPLFKFPLKNRRAGLEEFARKFLRSNSLYRPFSRHPRACRSPQVVPCGSRPRRSDRQAARSVLPER